MRLASALALTAILFVMNAMPQTPAELAELWEREHVVKKPASSLRVKDVIEQAEALRKLGIRVNEVGRSVADRPIFQAEWGRGPLKVFMWSQMHGDEPTATPVLFDMLTIFHNNRDKEWVKQIEEKITLRVVPMLNPDGAELFIRRNLQGIDINRDAVDLKTPEGRLLKSLRDAWQPEIGFNLHNQNY
ncbi:MAG TPA: peptidase M14, partial [Blastocatellia bacterium]|nr:peptidase M14 [Blastocatellia bacterium]